MRTSTSSVTVAVVHYWSQILAIHRRTSMHIQCILQWIPLIKVCFQVAVCVKDLYSEWITGTTMNWSIIDFVWINRGNDLSHSSNQDKWWKAQNWEAEVGLHNCIYVFLGHLTWFLYPLVSLRWTLKGCGCSAMKMCRLNPVLQCGAPFLYILKSLCIQTFHTICSSSHSECMKSFTFLVPTASQEFDELL